MMEMLLSRVVVSQMMTKTTIKEANFAVRPLRELGDEKPG